MGVNPETTNNIAKTKGINGLEWVAEAISKIKNVVDDFLSYIKNSIVKIGDRFAFKPAYTGLDDEFIMLNSSEINNISKIESITSSSGRLSDIAHEIPTDVYALVKKIKQRGTILDLKDETGKITYKRVLAPKMNH